MEHVNRADEYRRLEQLYADLSDKEVEAMSGRLEEFTDIAQQVLRAEMSRRGLSSQPLDSAEDPVEAARRALRAEIAEQGHDAQRQTVENESDPYLRDAFPAGLDPAGYDMRVLTLASDPAEAGEVMSLLEGAGVKAYMGPDNVENVDDYRGAYEDGVEIKVMKFQAKYAIAIYRRFVAGEPRHVPPEDESFVARCPKCNGGDIVFERIEVEPGKEPGPDAKYNWSCDACGHRWTDDGIEKAS